MIKIIKYTLLEKPSLLGLIDIQMVKWGGFIIHGCSVFQKNGHRWISFPSKKIEVPGGEVRYLPHNRFEDRAMQDRFSQAVLDSLDAWILAGNTPSKPEPRERQPDLPTPPANVSYGPGSNGAYEEQGVPF